MSNKQIKTNRLKDTDKGISGPGEKVEQMSISVRVNF